MRLRQRVTSTYSNGQMAKTVKLALAVEGTAFTKQGKVKTYKSPVKKQQESSAQPAQLGKRERQGIFEKVFKNSDSESEEGPRNKRPKRTIEDTPIRVQQQLKEESDQNEPMVYKSGSEEEYVPGKMKLN